MPLKLISQAMRWDYLAYLIGIVVLTLAQPVEEFRPNQRWVERTYRKFAL